MATRRALDVISASSLNRSELSDPSQNLQIRAERPVSAPVNQAKVQHRQRVAAAVIELLAERWPACFFVYEQHRRPLKIGIRDDILAALDEIAVSKRGLRRAMRSYVGNEVYCSRLVVGAVRIDLDGQPAGIVTREQTPPYWKTEKPIEKAGR